MTSHSYHTISHPSEPITQINPPTSKSPSPSLHHHPNSPQLTPKPRCWQSLAPPPRPPPPTAHQPQVCGCQSLKALLQPPPTPPPPSPSPTPASGALPRLFPLLRVRRRVRDISARGYQPVAMLPSCFSRRPTCAPSSGALKTHRKGSQAAASQAFQPSRLSRPQGPFSPPACWWPPPPSSLRSPLQLLNSGLPSPDLGNARLRPYPNLFSLSSVKAQV